MPRDYVRSRPGSSARFSSNKIQKSPPSRGPVWLLAGVFIGLVIAGVFYVKNHPAKLEPADVVTPPKPATAAAPANPEPSKLVKETNSEAPVLNHNNSSVNQQSASSASADTANMKKQASSQNLQTQFDFYNVLPGKNIVGPSGDEDTSALQPSQSSQPAPSAKAASPAANNAPANTEETDDTDDVDNTEEASDNTAQTDNAKSTQEVKTQETIKKNLPLEKPKPLAYVLQAGVFEQYADADNLKAQLVLLGFDAKISSYAKNGKTFKKVWLGPFRGAEEAKSVQDQLKENDITVKLLKSQN